MTRSTAPKPHPFRVGKWFDMGFDGELSRTAHHPELVEGEALLSVNPEGFD